MSSKNIVFKIRKAQSHGKKPIKPSEHSKKSMANQLRVEIRQLIEKADEAQAETRKFYERYEYWKVKRNEAETEYSYKAYRMWSDLKHTLGKNIQDKLKGVQKYESHKKMEKPKINDKKNKQYMKYGPSDDEEE